MEGPMKKLILNTFFICMNISLTTQAMEKNILAESELTTLNLQIAKLERLHGALAEYQILSDPDDLRILGFGQKERAQFLLQSFHVISQACQKLINEASETSNSEKIAHVQISVFKFINILIKIGNYVQYTLSLVPLPGQVKPFFVATMTECQGSCMQLLSTLQTIGLTADPKMAQVIEGDKIEKMAITLENFLKKLTS
jgi:hypothetical protein